MAASSSNSCGSLNHLDDNDTDWKANKAKATCGKDHTHTNGFVFKARL
jgi:hypothetical protein